jgi:hypothetical protein
MPAETSVDQPSTPVNHAGQWTIGLHKLAGIGPKTNAVVTRLVGVDVAFRGFHKLGDEALIALADSLSTPWSDECAAEFLDKLDRSFQASGHDVVGSDLCRWVRAHPNDSDAEVDGAQPPGPVVLD